MLIVVVLSVIMLGVIKLSVVVPMFDAESKDESYKPFLGRNLSLLK